MSGRIDAERILEAFLAPGADRLPDRVLDAALDDIARTPQRRALRVPWRFPRMPAFTRATSIAAVALVTALGFGGLFYLNANLPSGPGSTTTPSTDTQAPTVAPTRGASEVAPGVPGWTTYTSAIYSFAVGYPADWPTRRPAIRTWQPGDRLNGDAPYADAFGGPEEDEIGLFMWRMPIGEGTDIESVAGLTAWAETFCNDLGASGCDAFTQGAVPMCQALVIDPDVVECADALLVPTAGAQYAFVADRGSLLFTGIPDRITVVVIAREDDFPAAARYGGSLELLKAILTTMDVWTPGQVPNPYPG